MSHLLIVVTVRVESDRLPGKVVADVDGRPLLAWIVRRLKFTGGEVVLATTDRPADDAVQAVARAERIECHRHPGDPADVVGRVWAVIEQRPSARFILRGLGDCPFPDWELIKHGARSLAHARGDLFLWYGSPDRLPVYGAREMAHSRRLWSVVQAEARGEEREHCDLFVNRHRERFAAVYHDPPEDVYFRHPQQMRLEVDWPEDLELVRAVATRGPGMLAPLTHVVKWLDAHDEVAALNRNHVEVTGPVVSYPPELKRRWHKLMNGEPVLTWDGELVNPLDEKRAGQVCCRSCGRLHGWGFEGRLYLRGGRSILNEGRIQCDNCGEWLAWRRKR